MKKLFIILFAFLTNCGSTTIFYNTNPNLPLYPVQCSIYDLSIFFQEHGYNMPDFSQLSSMGTIGMYNFAIANSKVTPIPFLAKDFIISSNFYLDPMMNDPASTQKAINNIVQTSINFGLDCKTNITAPYTGNYDFSLTSDDGSQLFIEGAEVISNIGVHVSLTKSSSIILTQGKHKLELLYFQVTGNYALSLQWQTPDVYNQIIVPASSFTQ